MVQVTSADRTFGIGIWPDEPIWVNPFPESDTRHKALVRYFETMKVFQGRADEYPDLFITWKAPFAKWSGYPGVDVAKFRDLPGADYCVTTSAGEAATRLLPSLVTWFEAARDPWLNIADGKSWQVWFYAIRQFWLKAKEEAEDAGADMYEFAKKAKAVGYWPENICGVGARIWRKMVKSHKTLSEIRREPKLSKRDEIRAKEEVGGYLQDGRIKHVFKACVYFCGVLAAQRARELEASNDPASADSSSVAQPGEGTSRLPAGRSHAGEGETRMGPPKLDAYVSERFRISGGPREWGEREKLHEQFCILAVDFAGEFENCLDLLLRVSPNSNGRLIRDLLSGLEIELLKVSRRAAEDGNHAVKAYCSALEQRRVALRNEFAKYGDPAELQATLRVDCQPPQPAESAEPWHSVEEARARTYSWLEGRAAEQLQTAAGMAGQQPGQQETILNVSIARELGKVAADDPASAARRRGRRPNQERRDAIQDAITKHGDECRDHLSEIFKELDSKDVPLGDFHGREIDLGDGESTKVLKWDDLDLAQGEQRKQIIDSLRKYPD